jgi:hypothetical protein
MYTYFPHPKNGEEQFIDLRLEQESYILWGSNNDTEVVQIKTHDCNSSNKGVLTNITYPLVKFHELVSINSLYVTMCTINVNERQDENQNSWVFPE